MFTLPEQQTVVVEEIDDGEGFQEVEDNIRGDQLAMEDDIEKEIEELESQTGNTAMDDDIEKELAEIDKKQTLVMVTQTKRMILKKNLQS